MVAPSRKTCIFCGSTEMSAEHLYPDWLRQLYPVSKKSRHSTLNVSIRDETSATPGVSKSQRSHPRAINQIKAKVVCRKCNTGWMSRLESDAKPILKSLIAGERTILTAREHKVLACWAAKTVAVASGASFEIATEHLALPNIERRRIMRRALSKKWDIRVAFRQIHGVELGAVLHNGHIGSPKDKSSNTAVYNTTNSLIVLGPLVIFTLFSRLDFEAHEGTPVLEPFIRLLPYRGVAEWPPKIVIDEGRMKLVLIGLMNSIANPMSSGEYERRFGRKIVH
jgi:hypothetical protein